MSKTEQLAKAIVDKLEEKGALKHKLPLHLDRDKFLHLLTEDVRQVLDAGPGDYTDYTPPALERKRIRVNGHSMPERFPAEWE